MAKNNPRRDATPPVSAASRPRRRRFVWLAIVVLAGGGILFTRHEGLPSSEGEAKPLADWVPPGWRVATAPDRDGPYRKIDESRVFAPGEIGSFTYATPTGPTTFRISPPPNVRQQLLLLRAADGELTSAVLER